MRGGGGKQLLNIRRGLEYKLTEYFTGKQDGNIIASGTLYKFFLLLLFFFVFPKKNQKKTPGNHVQPVSGFVRFSTLVHGGEDQTSSV